MDELIGNLMTDASNVEKGAFLMVCGIVFVFAVQVVFYLAIKLWPRSKPSKPSRAEQV